MDSVRFGRVLGIGTRLAGKTLVDAVDAATAPNPGTRKQPEPLAETTREAEAPLRQAGVRAGSTVRQTRAGVRQGSRNFGPSVWRPFARASGVLWLEVTGVFFGLVALFGVQGVWMYRAAAWVTGDPNGHRHFILAVALAVIFGYFCVTSFVRARRKARG